MSYFKSKYLKYKQKYNDLRKLEEYNDLRKLEEKAKIVNKKIYEEHDEYDLYGLDRPNSNEDNSRLYQRMVEENLSDKIQYPKLKNEYFSMIEQLLKQVPDIKKSKLTDEEISKIGKEAVEIVDKKIEASEKEKKEKAMKEDIKKEVEKKEIEKKEIEKKEVEKKEVEKKEVEKKEVDLKNFEPKIITYDNYVANNIKNAFASKDYSGPFENYDNMVQSHKK